MREQVARRLAKRLGPARAARLNLALALLRRRRYIFLYSHMRSYSTLLGHLLATHAQIAGYAEQHLSYTSFDDLAELNVKIWKISDHRVRGDYLFDKLLHNKYVVSDKILNREDVLPIYGLREPLGSLRSLVAMGRRMPDDNWRKHPERAAEHVFNRYAALVDLAERRERACVLFMDSIINDPDPTLAQLSDYLGLKIPIQPTYDSMPKTGVGGYGDPMGPIKEGRIVVDRPEHDIEIDDELAARLAEAYRTTSAELTKRCSTVIGAPVADPRASSSTSHERC